MTDKNQPLNQAKNIGKTVEKHLNEISVFSLADLAALTPAKAYKKNLCQLSRQNHSHLLLPLCVGRRITG